MEERRSPAALLHDAYAVAVMARSGSDEAIQASQRYFWIASLSLAMTDIYVRPAPVAGMMKRITPRRDSWGFRA